MHIKWIFWRNFRGEDLKRSKSKLKYESGRINEYDGGYIISIRMIKD